MACHGSWLYYWECSFRLAYFRSKDEIPMFLHGLEWLLFFGYSVLISYSQKKAEVLVKHPGALIIYFGFKKTEITNPNLLRVS